MFRIRCVRLLSPCANAIILETTSSFVSPDYVCSPFTSTILLSSTRVYSPRRPTLYQRPYEYRVLTSPTSARRLSITSYELPRYTTGRLFFMGIHHSLRYLSFWLTDERRCVAVDYFETAQSFVSVEDICKKDCCSRNRGRLPLVEDLSTTARRPLEPFG